MPSTDSTDSGDSRDSTDTAEEVPVDALFSEWKPSHELVVASGLSVMAFATFSTMNAFANGNDNGFVAFAFTIPFFFGAYLAVRGLFNGLEEKIGG